jgi:hypothetical protein
MVAISLLLFVFRARDHRGLDGDLQPRTIGDAPKGPERSGGHRRRDFLVSRGMGVAQGKKVLSDGVAAQTIEAQPVFGQIEPAQRPGASRAEPQLREKMAGLGSTRQEVGTVRRRKRNEGRQKADIVSAKPIANERL